MSSTACNMYVSVCQSADKSVRVPILLLRRVCRPSSPIPRLLPRVLPSGLGLGLGRAKKDPELRATGLMDVLRRNAAARHDDDRYRTSRGGSRWSDVHQGCRRYLGSVDVCRSISDRRCTRSYSVTERVRESFAWRRTADLKLEEEKEIYICIINRRIHPYPIRRIFVQRRKEIRRGSGAKRRGRGRIRKEKVRFK